MPFLVRPHRVVDFFLFSSSEWSLSGWLIKTHGKQKENRGPLSIFGYGKEQNILHARGEI